MQLVVKTKPDWPARYQPVNHVATMLASLMRVEFLTRSNLLTWLHMGGTVIVDGKPFVGD